MASMHRSGVGGGPLPSSADASLPGVLSAGQITELAACEAVFLPADPPRAGRVAFWRTDGGQPMLIEADPAELTVVRPHGSGARRRNVPAVAMPVARALPVLTRARNRSGSAAYWGAASLIALQLVARGRLLPGVSQEGFDAWRVGPMDGDDIGRVRELAAAMPPEARAVPVPGVSPLTLPDAEPLVRAFLDAVADGLPRTPAAPLAAGGSAFAAATPQKIPEHRDWAAEIAAGMDAGVRLSLRLELPDINGYDVDDPEWPEAPGTDDGQRFRAVLQLHSLADPTVVADAIDVWTDSAVLPDQFGPRTRIDTLLALRRARHAWEPIARLLTAAAPDAIELADSEVADLLGEAAVRLHAAGIQVHWPKEIVRELTATGILEAPARKKTQSDAPSILSADQLLTFRWRVAVGGEPVSDEEMARLVEAHRPLVRLRDQWVVVNPELIRKVQRHRERQQLTAIDALGAALTGALPVDGELVPVAASGALEELRARIADPEAASDPEAKSQPTALSGTLRDYQLRGVDWLDRMTRLGLGCCLADDMGLGKTITLISLHLRRQEQKSTAAPTLVVCPTSLLGNWEREIHRFAPGTPVRRFHGQGRTLDDLEQDSFVLTTYGTLRRDAAALADVPWGLLVADEAQHVKNPYSNTAHALRAVPSAGRVALTGTPVENNLSELWALLDWTTPGLLGSLTAFRTRYAKSVEGAQDQDTADRLARLVRPFLLRRRKSDPGIAPELPPKTETDQPVALTREQASLYEALVHESLAAIAAADGITRRGLVVKLLTGLKQVCNHPAHYLKEADGTRLDGRSGKLELLDELLDTILAEHGAALVFTQYVEMARLIERHLADRGVTTQFLHGRTPVKRREEMVARFQAGEAPVFLLSLKAAGTGLNLTRAGHVIHFDRWWNPAVEDQATDRAYRIGQTQPVQVHRMIAEGTVEDRIAQLLKQKKDLAEAVLGSGEAAFTELSDAELAELVTLRRDTGIASGRKAATR